jgi:beta-glucosidase/6-phospho-beta-glucosidase/beta-galactosidase
VGRLCLSPFPADFLWGVATSAYQVEGNITENDGYIFTTSPEIKRKIRLLSSLVGREIDLEPAGEAVHHGNIDVLKEDLDRARLLGMNAYRFSIDWSRIFLQQSLDFPSPGILAEFPLLSFYPLKHASRHRLRQRKHERADMFAEYR